MPMEQHTEHADEWSHMSDYDEMGMAPHINEDYEDAVDGGVC